MLKTKDQLMLAHLFVYPTKQRSKQLQMTRKKMRLTAKRPMIVKKVLAEKSKSCQPMPDSVSLSLLSILNILLLLLLLPSMV